MDVADDALLSSLESLSGRVQGALHSAGLRTVGDVRQRTDVDLLKVKRLGPGLLRELRDVLGPGAPLPDVTTEPDLQDALRGLARFGPPEETPQALHRQGFTREEIAARLGMPLREVRKALRGLPTQHRGGRPAGRERTEGVFLRFSPEELAEVERAAGDRPLAAWCREVVVERARRREEG